MGVRTTVDCLLTPYELFCYIYIFIIVYVEYLLFTTEFCGAKLYILSR